MVTKRKHLAFEREIDRYNRTLDRSGLDGETVKEIKDRFDRMHLVVMHGTDEGIVVEGKYVQDTESVEDTEAINERLSFLWGDSAVFKLKAADEKPKEMFRDTVASLKNKNALVDALARQLRLE